MKIEEAINQIDGYLFDMKRCGIEVPEDDDRLAMRILLNHAEATRWRKLEEEKPEKAGEYETYASETAQWSVSIEIQYWSKDQETNGYFGFWDRATHWRPIVGPEEDS